MSAGNFQTVVYTANSGSTHALRIQPETLDLSIEGIDNDAASGPPSSPIRAKSSKSNGQVGLRPRKINVRFTAPPPAGYATGQVYCVPALQEAIWNAAVDTATGTYLGTAVVVVSRAAEDIN